MKTQRFKRLITQVLSQRLSLLMILAGTLLLACSNDSDSNRNPIEVPSGVVSSVSNSVTGSSQVSENAVNGDTVGIIAVATEAGGGTISYSLSDDAGGLELV